MFVFFFFTKYHYLPPRERHSDGAILPAARPGRQRGALRLHQEELQEGLHVLLQGRPVQRRDQDPDPTCPLRHCHPLRADAVAVVAVVSLLFFFFTFTLPYVFFYPFC